MGAVWFVASRAVGTTLTVVAFLFGVVVGIGPVLYLVVFAGAGGAAVAAIATVYVAIGLFFIGLGALGLWVLWTDPHGGIARP